MNDPIPSLARLTVVLVSPRNPLNIGAAARAMANFGFNRLAVVAPYEDHWREAKSAVGAENLLQSAHKTATIAEAVADSTFVIGTASLNRRKPDQPIVSLPDLPPIVQRQLECGRVAILFGSEKRGLTRDDLALCHLLVEIPTSSRQPSMNLGQAVAVCLYELTAQHGNPALVMNPDSSDPPPDSRDLDLLAGVVSQTMLAANDSPGAMRKANHHDLHLLLRRLSLNRSDARRILGLFRRILWRLQHGATGTQRNSSPIPHK